MRNSLWLVMTLVVFTAFLTTQCISKRKYLTNQDYNQKLREVVSDWYQAELKELNNQRQKRIDRMSVTLPEYKGIKDLKVVLEESIERIDDEYTKQLIQLDSLREAKIRANSVSIKSPKLSSPKL